MKEKFIKNLQEGEEISNEVFVVKNIAQKTTSAGKCYADLNLADKTGEVNAKIWTDNLDLCETAKAGDFVIITAFVEEYKGSKQLNIKQLNKMNSDEIDLNDFIKKTDNDIDELYKKVEKSIEKVENQYIKKLLENFYVNDKDLMAKIKQAPAAEKLHHAYIGGYLEHLVQMLNLAETLSADFPKINMDLVIAGVLFHDIGKLEELNIDSRIFRTVKGSLLGHLSISALLVDEAINKIQDFPEEIKNQLLHIILSHHGELEFGSPVKPMTTEAMVVYYLDDISTKVNMVYNLTEEDQDKDADFSDWHSALARRIYLGDVNKSKEQEIKKSLND